MKINASAGRYRDVRTHCYKLTLTAQHEEQAAWLAQLYQQILSGVNIVHAVEYAKQQWQNQKEESDE